jgi:hypothetical protein
MVQDIDIAISKPNTIISEIYNGHVYNLAHACIKYLAKSFGVFWYQTKIDGI